MRKSAITRFVVMFVICLFNSGCGDLGLNVDNEPQGEEASESPDASALEMIRNNEVAEARAWLLDGKKHMLWKGDRDAIKRLVERLYGAGTPKVYAAGISREGETEIVAMFMAELPTDPALRANIFKTQADFWKSYLDEPTAEDLEEIVEKDNGQKYLMLNFDL